MQNMTKYVQTGIFSYYVGKKAKTEEYTSVKYYWVTWKANEGIKECMCIKWINEQFFSLYFLRSWGVSLTLWPDYKAKRSLMYRPSLQSEDTISLLGRDLFFNWEIKLDEEVDRESQLRLWWMLFTLGRRCAILALQHRSRVEIGIYL